MNPAALVAVNVSWHVPMVPSGTMLLATMLSSVIFAPTVEQSNADLHVLSLAQDTHWILVYAMIWFSRHRKMAEIF